MSEFEIEHKEQQQMFCIELEGDSAHVKYRFPTEGTVDFYTTFVPPEHRKHGLAAGLVDTALDWAEQQGLQIETSCWYAEKRFSKRAQT